MCTKTDTKPVEIFWENYQRRIFASLGAQSGPKIGPLHTSKSICNKHVKQDWCENFLRKWPNTRMFTYFGAQNSLRNWAFEAHIVHISKSSSNEHIKQDWYESRGKFLIFEKLNFDSFGGPKIWAFGAYLLHTH